MTELYSAEAAPRLFECDLDRSQTKMPGDYLPDAPGVLIAGKDMLRRQLRWLIWLVVRSSPITRRTNVCVSLHASNNRMRENSLKGHVPAALWA